MQKTVSANISYKPDCPVKYSNYMSITIPLDGFHHEEEVIMDVEQRELEVLDEGRDNTEELNTCCSGAKARA